MDRGPLLELVELLGREFEQRGMANHLENLRVYYVAVRSKLDRGRERSVRVSWSEEMTVEWLSLLRVAPYHERYPVRQPGYRCTCAAGAAVGPSGRSGDWSHIGRGTAMTTAVFPGGSKARCGSCRAEWIELEADVPAAPIETDAAATTAVAAPVEERHKRPPPTR